MSLVSELFGVVAERMRADLRITRAAVTHPGLRGAGFEESFRTFLRNYLPKSLDVSTGILVDAHGRSSKQLDVIISDAAKTPVFYSVGETRVIPIECAYMVFEVKAHLNRSTLQSCFANMESVRGLKKTAFLSEDYPIIRRVEAYGLEWPIYPLNYFVFAYDSIDLIQLTHELHAKYETEGPPSDKRIDSICVLDRGVICNKLPNGTYDALPTTGSHVFLCPTDNALLLFYTLISRYFNQTWLPSFRFLDYLGEMAF